LESKGFNKLLVRSTFLFCVVGFAWIVVDWA
jgi:hypothetical protein